MTLNPTEDYSSCSSFLSFVAIRRLKQVLHHHQLINVWRILHPSGEDYCYYSAVHDTYTRIDLFLTKHGQLSTVVKADIGNIAMLS